MKRKLTLAIAASITAVAFLGCSSEDDGGELFGQAEVALTNAPEDVACLRISVDGQRSDVRTFSVTPGEKQVFVLDGLPVGVVSVSADAFALECNGLANDVAPTWFSETVAARIQADRRTHIALAMIHNGQASIGVDFDDDHGNVGDEAPLTGGVFSSQPSYLLPSEPGVRIKPILTVGDAVGTKPDGSPYRMVGVPDGLGAFDNGDGTFTLLANHELGANNGVVRAHGARGAFVSKWIVRKADLAVLSGEDLIKRAALWDPSTSSYAEPATGVAFGRFCSSDLPDQTALYDVETGLGFDGRLYFNGEEIGSEGRALAHGLDGVTYELPRFGKASWENIVLSPKAGVKTISANLDDSGGGQVYVYVGTKTDGGSPVERAGLTNGTLYGLRVVGHPVENNATGIPTAPFEMYELGNVENWTGARLEAESNANLVTKFQRPEDGAWDPNDPNHFYFVTTASFSGNSRLWRLAFVDAARPELGGTIEMLLDGSEGHRMLDNVSLDQRGRLYLQEDVGNNAHLGKIWRYDIADGSLVEVARHDAAAFLSGGARFLTQDEESTGIIDASNILGPGWFLTATQAHYNAGNAELVEGGQLQALFDPGSAE